jgi:hypothetical protein
VARGLVERESGSRVLTLTAAGAAELPRLLPRFQGGRWVTRAIAWLRLRRPFVAPEAMHSRKGDQSADNHVLSNGRHALRS